MEKHIPNDRMEEFLRKTLENYAESPPDDVWEGISHGLDAAAPPTSGIRFLRHLGKPWLAAASLVVGLLTAQHVYFQSKIEELHTAVKEARTSADEARQAVASMAPASPQQVAVAEQLTPSTTSSAVGKSAQPAAPTSRQPMPERTPEYREPARQDAPNLTPPPSQVRQEVVANPPTANQSALPQLLAPAPPEIVQQTAAPAAASMSPILKKLSLEPIELPSLKLPKPDIKGLKVPPMRHLSVSVHGGSYATQTKTVVESPPGMPRPIFDGDEAVGSTVSVGIGIEKNIGRGWSFVTGADYMATELQAEHKAKLRFEQGHHHPGGPGGPGGPDPHEEEHDFDFDLNTSSGIVALSVTVAQDSATGEIEDEEEIDFNIKTEIKHTWVSVPVALKYGYQFGRFGLYGKGGVAVNMLLNNSVEIEDIEAQHDRIQARPLNTGKGKPSGLPPVTIDALASAGFSYSATPSLSIFVEPSARVGITRRSSETFVQTAQRSFGLQTGIAYRF